MWAYYSLRPYPDLPYIYSTEGKIKEPNLAAEAGQGLLSAVSSYARGDMVHYSYSVYQLVVSRRFYLIREASFRQCQAFSKQLQGPANAPRRKRVLPRRAPPM